jgi:hypothetical protein
MMQEEEVRKECVKFIIDSKESTSYKEQKDRGRLNQDFFRGGKKHWSEEEYNIYKSKGVEPISINRSKPVIKGLLGMYLQNRQAVKVRPRQNGTQSVARVWTEILKHTQDISYADYVYAALFLRGSIDTESYLKLEIDKTENINGQPRIVSKTIMDIIADRNATEYNLDESAKYVIERGWKDKAELDAEHPERKKSIDDVLFPGEGKSIVDRITTSMANWMSEESDIDHYEDEEDLLPDYEYLRKYRYLLHKVYWKEIVPAVLVADKQEKRLTKVTDEKKAAKLRRKAKKSVRFEIINYAAKVLHETLILGNALLQDTPNPYGENISSFPIVRFAPIWDDGFACGALDDVVPLNKEENINRTQSLRILNQLANSGWVVGSDNDKKYIAILKDFGSVEGIVLPKDKFGGFLEKITPNQPAQGQHLQAAQFEQDIKRVSGVDDAIHGYETGKVESGVAIHRKQTASKVSNEPYFNNLYRTLEIFGNFMLQVIVQNDFYSDEEIQAIVGDSGLMDTKMIQQAHNRLVAMIGVDLPEPQLLPPIDPGVMAVIKPDDQPMVLETVREGTEAALRYEKAYPRLRGTWDDVIKQQATAMLLQELRNDTTGKYGVKVTVSPSAPTERMARLAEIEAVQEKYGIIPPDIFIDATDLPNKEEIKARMQQQAEAARQQQMQGAV